MSVFALILFVFWECVQKDLLDVDYYGYLLSTENLWGNEVFEYASRTFYPNLPEEVKEKYRIHDLIKYIPKEAFKLDDY